MEILIDPDPFADAIIVFHSGEGRGGEGEGKQPPSLFILNISTLWYWFHEAFGWVLIHKWIKMSKVLRIKGKPKLAPISTRQPRDPICSQTMQQTQTQLKGWQQDRLQNLPRSQMLLLPKLGMRVPDCHPTKRKKRNDIMWWDKTHPTSTSFIAHWKKSWKILLEMYHCFQKYIH